MISRYVFLFQRNGGNFLFNARTNSFYRLQDDAYNALSEMKEGNCVENLPKEFLSALEDKKIIVTEEQEKSYLDYLRLSYYKSAYNSVCLNLTIVPTVSCNLRCPYCFEQTKPSGMMNDEIVKKLVDFVKKNAISNKYSIIWFGGEPVLGISVIEKILLMLEKEADYKMTSHSIVTNGTLLNSEAIRVFKQFPLDSIQITLDGMKETHDSKRFFESGTGSFDLILRNIDVLLKEMQNTHITFRVNVDNSNKEEYLQIYNILSERYKGYSISVYPGILRANKGCENETFFSSEDHLKFSSMLWQHKMQDMYPSHCSKGCCATSLSSHVIGPKGEMYICWEHVGIEDKIVGYIDGEKGKFTDNYSLYKLRGHCFDDALCLECGLLPLCSGGCADKRVKNIVAEEENNLCSIYKEKGNKGLEDALYEYYKLKNGVM